MNSSPNQAVLISSIPLLEAEDSSEIGTSSPARIASFSLPTADRRRPPTKSASLSNSAMRGFRPASPSTHTTRTAVNICRTIKGVDIDIRKTPGTALINDPQWSVIYTPPKVGSATDKLAANWGASCTKTELVDPRWCYPWPSATISSKTIHPFVIKRPDRPGLNCCIWSNRACSTSRCSTSPRPSSGQTGTTPAPAERQPGCRLRIRGFWYSCRRGSGTAKWTTSRIQRQSGRSSANRRADET